jgi:peptide deformylase
MAILNICKYGKEILRTKTKRINFNLLEKKLPKIINDMTQTCLAYNGVGLAATQVGLDIALAVVLLPQEEEGSYKRYVLINPEISNSQGSVLSSEGCLSFPGLNIQVPRAKKVKVKYLNEKGLPVELNAEGFLAIILQHEIDHLNGKVFIDKVSQKDLPKVQAELEKLSKEW